MLDANGADLDLATVVTQDHATALTPTRTGARAGLPLRNGVAALCGNGVKETASGHERRFMPPLVTAGSALAPDISQGPPRSVEMGQNRTVSA